MPSNKLRSVNLNVSPTNKKEKGRTLAAHIPALFMRKISDILRTLTVREDAENCARKEYAVIKEGGCLYIRDCKFTGEKMSEQPKWLERAKETYKFHRDKLIINKKWTTVQTAKALRRSIGSISEDLLIARWLRTHEINLEKFKYAYEAIEWIKDKQREQETMELD